MFLGLTRTEKSVLGRDVILGASIQSLLETYEEDSVIYNSLKELESVGFFLFLDKKDRVCVLLSDNLSKESVFRAYVEACFMAKLRTVDEAKIEVFLEKLKRAKWRLDYLQMSTAGWSGS